MNILMIEDDYTDASQIIAQVNDTKDVKLLHVDTLHKALVYPNAASIDLILLDLYLPDSRGLDTLMSLRERYRSVPVIILTEINDEELAIQALNHGAQDYIPKNEITRNNFLRTVRYAIERNKNLKYIEEMNQKLIELNKKKNDFLSIASHDIRTPLSTVYTLSEMLVDDTAAFIQREEKLKRMLEMIYTSSKKILNIVNYFMNVSKIENEIIELEKTEFEYIGFVRGIIESFADKAANKQINISFSSDRPEITITADQGKMEQVLNNIISNGIKYSHENSSMKIHVTIDEHRLLTECSDQGIGVPPEKLDDIFNPYKKAGQPTGGEDSTGLGLAIAKLIVTAHQGQIGIRSEEEKGSCFYFSLPL